MTADDAIPASRALRARRPLVGAILGLGLAGALAPFCWLAQTPPARDHRLVRSFNPPAAAPAETLAPASTPEGPRYPYYRLIQQVAAKYQVAPELIAGIVRLESNFDRTCTSPVGAAGLMQLMPETARLVARGMGWKHYDLYDPQTNLELGTRYFVDLLREFDGHTPTALSYYNAGRYGVVSRGVYRNRRYIRIVMDNYWDYLRAPSEPAAPAGTRSGF